MAKLKVRTSGGVEVDCVSPAILQETLAILRQYGLIGPSPPMVTEPVEPTFNVQSAGTVSEPAEPTLTAQVAKQPRKAARKGRAAH